ncbi:MAG: ATP-binding protein, partial [Longimicrobiales bacterium]
MSLAPVCGHEEVRASLARAVREDRLPGSILLYGPTGSGRQRVGLWLGQLLLCERTDPEPCGECLGCRLVLRLEHPDLHWFFPLARPRGGMAGERLIEALEDARAEALDARRSDPLQPFGQSEAVGLYLAQVHAIRRLASTRPAMAARQVFLIGDAELLVPQESSPEAANALLKLLEEPPDSTVFVLTASDPEMLLPTVRSRLLPVRLRALPEDRVAAYLTEQRGASGQEVRRAARLGQGTIGRALGFLPVDGEAGPLEEVRQQGRALLIAAADPRPTA